LDYRTARDLIRLLATRQVSAVELLECAVTRIEACDRQINAVVVRDFERARDAAKAADAALARGERAPLLGLPMTVKESFNVAGLPTTWGVPAASNWRPNEDALAVARLKAAGAVILGKTNVPLRLADGQTFNDTYGTTNNPWDPTRTPGARQAGQQRRSAAGCVSLDLAPPQSARIQNVACSPISPASAWSHCVVLRTACRHYRLKAMGRRRPMARSAADLAWHSS
jgi:amidase